MTNSENSNHTLAQTEQRLNQLLEHSNDGLWEVDLDGRIRFSNEQVNSVLFMTVDEIQNASVFDYLEADDQSAFKRMLEMMRTAPEVVKFQATSWKRKDADAVITENTYIPLKDGDSTKRVFIISKDVTAQVEAEKELGKRFEEAEIQQKAIEQLSTPILEIWEGILVLPVVGFVDTVRSSEMTDKLLEAVVTHRARGVLIDITGIDVLDTKTADHFIKMAKAVRLLGAESVVTGISPAIAQTLTHIDVDLTGLETLRSLRDGLVWFLTEFEKNAGNNYSVV